MDFYKCDDCDHACYTMNNKTITRNICYMDADEANWKTITEQEFFDSGFTELDL